MKKIKYLILILPLLFITNVKAECTNFFNANTFTTFKNGSYQNLTPTIISSDSLSIWTYNGGAYFGPISFETSISYILSFDIETSLTTSSALSTKLYDENSGNSYNLTNLLDAYTSDSSSFKYKFTAPRSSLMLRFTNNNSGTLTLKNVKLHLESEYDSCIHPIVTYTYRFLVDNEVYSTGIAEENTVIELPDPPTKEGYTFIGWTLNGEEYLGESITSDIDIIANFIENQVNPISTTNIDFSDLIPYFILIASLIMIIILRDFIKSIFKSRRQ